MQTKGLGNQGERVKAKWWKKYCFVQLSSWNDKLSTFISPREALSGNTVQLLHIVHKEKRLLLFPQGDTCLNKILWDYFLISEGIVGEEECMVKEEWEAEGRNPLRHPRPAAKTPRKHFLLPLCTPHRTAINSYSFETKTKLCPR